MVDRFTPDFRVEIDGIDRTRNVWEYLESIHYDDAESGESDSLNLIVANDPPFTIPRPGAEVKFWLGWKESGLKFFGTFVVDSSSIELNPAKMSISAKSANFNSSAKGSKDEKERRDREWENVTLADIAAKIAAEHGGNSKVEWTYTILISPRPERAISPFCDVSPQRWERRLRSRTTRS